MKSVYHSRAVASEPDIPVSETSEGCPTNGSATGGQLSTIIGAYWYHMITKEIENAVRGGGIEPDAADLTQLNRSIQNRIDSGLEGLRSALQGAINEIGNKVAQQGIPTGTIMAFDLDGAPDAYWIPCDGRAVSRTTYAALFAKIGTRHGAGNGATTFNVPNLVGRVLWGSNYSIGQMIEAGLPNITGAFGGGGQERNTHVEGAFYDTGGNQNVADAKNTVSKIVGFSASRSSPVYGRSDTVQPPAMRTLFCIHV